MPDARGLSARFIYLAALRTGLGSAPVGLDRLQNDDSQILAFRRIGKMVVAEFENWKFRAINAPPEEQKAARDAFAYSTVWAGSIESVAPDGRLLVDISKFLTRDVMGVVDSLAKGGSPGYKPCPEQTFAEPGAVKVFPENVEFEVLETFASDSPGAEVRNIAPEPKQISFVVHHSLIRLPDEGYKPRLFDPRTGTFSLEVIDYASPLGSPMVKDLALRFRLEKLDPTAIRSRVKKPIVFLVDRAAPEPIRSALMEGASWWAKAFEDAGFLDAYRVEAMPEGVDPLDVRYNAINWVDRATRGWSYGQPVIDPRYGRDNQGVCAVGYLTGAARYRYL